MSEAAAPMATDTNPTGAPAPVETPPAAAASDWTSGLPDTAKVYVTQKGFKDPAAVLDSYQNLEKLLGAPKERLLKLPEKADAPEWGEIYDKLGRPKNANEYKFAAPEGGEVNKEFTERAQKKFHELGLNRPQAEKIAEWWNQEMVGDVQKQKEVYEASVKNETDALKREWGAAYQQKLKDGQKAAQMFGLQTEEISKLEQALGYSATLKFLANLGSKVGESSFVDGGQKGFQGAMTPGEATAQLAMLKQDQDFVRRYLAGEVEAKVKMETLLKFANPEFSA